MGYNNGARIDFSQEFAMFKTNSIVPPMHYPWDLSWQMDSCEGDMWRGPSCLGGSTSAASGARSEGGET